MSPLLFLLVQFFFDLVDFHHAVLLWLAVELTPWVAGPLGGVLLYFTLDLLWRALHPRPTAPRA